MQSSELKRLLITGAAGKLGSKLRHRLKARADFEVLGLDKDVDAGPNMFTADIAQHGSWVRHFRGVDTVVHLAANANPWADWGSLVEANVDGIVNVLDAAVAHGVRRFVFASSLHTMLGYLREPRAIIETQLTPAPMSLYGVTKAVGERLARHYAIKHGLSVVCLRFGYVVPGDELPSADCPVEVQRRWLSSEDFYRSVERAISVDEVGFEIVTVTSDVEGSSWDLTDAWRVLGYRPRDALDPKKPPVHVTARRKVRSLLSRFARRSGLPIA